MRAATQSILQHIRALVSERSRFGVAAAAVLPIVCALAIVAVLGAAADAQDRIPVAVVNLDEGATGADGARVRAGEDLVDDLAESGDLAWSVVGEDEAVAGLSDGTYELALTIPENYSACVASVEKGDPRQAEVTVTAADGGNAFAEQAGSAVLKQVQARVRADLGENYVLSSLSDVQGSASKLTLTADGATMLDEGYEQLADGSEAVGEGMRTMADAVPELADGLDQIASGVTGTGTGTLALAEGISALDSQGTSQLASGAGALAQASDTMAEGLSSLSLIAGGFEEGFGTLSSTLDEAEAGLRALAGAVADADALAGQLHDATAPGGSLGAAVDAVGASSQRAQETLGEVSEAAAGLPAQTEDLARELSSDDAENPGVAEEASALAAEVRALAERQRAAEAAGAVAVDDRYAASGAEAEQGTGATSGVAEAQATEPSIEALQDEVPPAAETGAASAAAGVSADELDAIADRLQALEERAQGVSDDARELNAAADTVANAGTAGEENLDALNDSATELQNAAAEASDNASAIVCALDGSAVTADTPGAEGGGTGEAAGTDGTGSSDLAGQLPDAPEAGAGLSAGLNMLADGVASAGDAVDNQIVPLASTLTTGLDVIGEQLSSRGTFGGGLGALSTGASALSSGMTTMADAASQLGAANVTLGAALGQASAGTGSLSAGLGQLAEANDAIGEGIGQLREASQDIGDTVADEADALSDVARNRADRAEVGTRQVSFTRTLSQNGSSVAATVAPGVLAIAVWVGALALSVAAEPYGRRLALAGANPVAVAALGAVPLAGFALAQTLVGALLLSAVFGTAVASPAAYLGVCAVGSVAIAFVAQALRLWLGRLAVPVSCALALVQALCAGTFLSASFVLAPLAALGAVLPVPEFASALRTAACGTGSLVAPVIGLAVFALLGLAASAAAVWRRSLVRPERL